MKNDFKQSIPTPRKKSVHDPEESRAPADSQKPTKQVQKGEPELSGQGIGKQGRGVAPKRDTGASLEPQKQDALQALKNRINKIIAEQLGVKEEELKDNPQFSFQKLGADSLDAVELIMAFEEEFSDELQGKEIPDTEAESLTTVQSVYDYLTPRIVKEEPTSLQDKASAHQKISMLLSQRDKDPIVPKDT